MNIIIGFKILGQITDSVGSLSEKEFRLIKDAIENGDSNFFHNGHFDAKAAAANIWAFRDKNTYDSAIAKNSN